MAWRFVLQPNGKLARFSDIVDDFTHINLSEQEAIEVCYEVSPFEQYTPDEARTKVQAGLDDIKPWSTIKGSGRDRWDDALKRVKIVHGQQQVDALIKQMS